MITAEYIDHMGDDLRVANVARVSFNNWKEEQDDKDARLIDYLARNEHTSPFRHTAITLRCSTPIWLSRQLGKHQIGCSWNETSRRYVSTEPEFFMPEVYRKAPEGSIKQGSGEAHEDSEFYRIITKSLHEQALLAYNKMIKNGVAPEQARGILPQNMMTTWVWTGTLTAFYHMYRLRINGHAQQEAQVFAKLVGDIIEPLFPICWKALKSNSI